jgi:long-chain acyl-CoA synthetase
VSEPIRFLSDALKRNATELASHPALWFWNPRGRLNRQPSFSWSELAECVDFLADRLADLLSALPPDQQRVVHQVANTPNDLLVALACLAAGIVESPVDAEGGDAYLESCRIRLGGLWLDDEAKREIVHCSYANYPASGPPSQVRNRACRKRRVVEDDDALVLWTSGTSGDPKGVVLSHRSLLRNAEAKLRAVPQSITDRRLTVLSIAHAYARTCDLGTWLLSGCSLAIAHGFQGWSDAVGVVSPTLCNMVPSLADRTLDEGLIPDSLRLIGCGGAAMAADRFEQWQRRGVTVIQGYGLTEAGPVVSSQTPGDSIAGHAGCFVQGWEHRLEEGRLFVRGDGLMTRYWNDPDGTGQRIDPQGWLDTGDVVRICPSTLQLEILGRSDDRLVLSNGYVIDPQAIETKVKGIRGIRTAVVTTCSDRRTVELWIETDAAPLSTHELGEVCRALPRWEQPRRVIEFVVPEPRRSKLFNRKGAIRRTEMLRFLAELACG